MCTALSDKIKINKTVGQQCRGRLQTPRPRYWSHFATQVFSTSALCEPSLAQVAQRWPYSEVARSGTEVTNWCGNKPSEHQTIRVDPCPFVALGKYCMSWVPPMRYILQFVATLPSTLVLCSRFAVLQTEAALSLQNIFIGNQEPEWQVLVVTECIK